MSSSRQEVGHLGLDLEAVARASPDSKASTISLDSRGRDKGELDSRTRSVTYSRSSRNSSVKEDLKDNKEAHEEGSSKRRAKTLL